MKKFTFIFSALLLIIATNSCKKLGQLPGHGKPPVIYDSLKHDLLAYYPFAGNTNDGSGNNLNGTGTDLTPTTDRNNKANFAYHFNGASSNVSVSDIPALRLNNIDFSLNVWVKLDNYGSSFGSNIFSKHIPGINNGWVIGITGYGGVVNAGLVTFGPGGGSPSALSTATVTLNQWHMITATYTLAKQEIRIYIDGVLNSVTDGIPTPNSTIDAPLTIGRDSPGASQDGYFVLGSIDEARIYTRVLSLNNIKNLYMSNN